MNTTSIYFFALIALFFVIALLYLLGTVFERSARILTPIAAGLHLPLVFLAFFAEASLRVLLLILLSSAFLYTLPRFVRNEVERRRGR